MVVNMGIIVLAAISLWLFNSVAGRLVEWAQCGKMRARSETAIQIGAVAVVHGLIILLAFIGIVMEYASQ